MTKGLFSFEIKKLAKVFLCMKAEAHPYHQIYVKEIPLASGIVSVGCQLVDLSV